MTEQKNSAGARRQTAGSSNGLQSNPANLEWNRWAAAKLREAGQLLARQNANPFRAGAYERAAQTVETVDFDLSGRFAEGGPDALIALPNIGHSIAAAISEMLQTGRWAQLERLRGDLDPEILFQSLPGIGPKLSQEIHEDLHVDTLEALEAAAYDGRLEAVPGIGPNRLTIIRQSLTEVLARRRPRSNGRPDAQPPVSLILSVDAEYRRAADAGKLPKIKPRRFNPEEKAWLPVLHTEREGWSFTALFSNTARANALHRTRDWVVIYFHRDEETERQCTVVTEHNGPLRGYRVVRGRENECAVHYAHLASDVHRGGG